MDFSVDDSSYTLEYDSPRSEKRKSCRVQRACFNCRKRKQGCDEERPCKRCVEKGIECEEVEVKRKRGRIRIKKLSRQEGDKGRQLELQTDSSSSFDDYNGLETSSDEETSQVEEPISIPTVEPLVDNDALNIAQNKDKNLFGLNLGQLLPFLVNLVRDSPRFEKENNSWADYSIQDLFDTSLPTKQELCLNLTDSVEMDDLDWDCEVFWQIREWWNTTKNALSDDESLRREFDKVRQTWQEIMQCMRSLQWHKVRSYLQEFEATSCSSLEPSPPIVIWSSGGRIHHANESFCKLVGYSVEELLSKANGQGQIWVHALFHPEEIVGILKRQLEALQHPSRSAFHLKTRLLTKFRQEIPVSLSLSNVRDSVGSSLTVAHFVTSH